MERTRGQLMQRESKFSGAPFVVGPSGSHYVELDAVQTTEAVWLIHGSVPYDRDVV